MSDYNLGVNIGRTRTDYFQRPWKKPKLDRGLGRLSHIAIHLEARRLGEGQREGRFVEYFNEV